MSVIWYFNPVSQYKSLDYLIRFPSRKQVLKELADGMGQCTIWQQIHHALSFQACDNNSVDTAT
jgi:hypothetical protein